MAINLDVNGNIDLLFKKLQEFLKSKTVIGEPMNIGESTLIPVVNVSFGLGSGGGDGSDGKGNGGVGGGAGIGARISPSALIVIKGDKVEVLPIKKSSNLEKLVELVPEIVNELKDKKSGSETEEEKGKEE